MKTFKFLTVLILGLVIFGSAGYFGYILFIKPARLEKREQAAKASAPAATPTPDSGIPGFQRIKALQAAGVTPAVREEWAAWIASNANSPLIPQARQLLGTANMTLLFNPAANPTLQTYSVVKGDSLAKIASKQHSSAELIQRANQLPNINLQIGQQLVIPQLKISLEINRAAKSVTLLDNGTYLKEYAFLASPAAPKAPSTVNSKVLDKSALSGAKRVAFGDKAYASAEKVILLTQAPSIVCAQATATSPTPVAETGGTNAPAASPAPTAAPLPGGFVLSTEDLQEIFPLVSRNTPVIIH
jgi:LysM repeat protein